MISQIVFQREKLRGKQLSECFRDNSLVSV